MTMMWMISSPTSVPGRRERVHDYVPDGQAERAEAIYDIRCAGCHGVEGKDGIYDHYQSGTRNGV